MRALVVAALVALAGCYAPTGKFRPLSRGMMNQPRMVKVATEIFDGDLVELRDGGGMYIGTLSMPEPDGQYPNEPAKDAAHFGATHYLLKRSDGFYLLYRVPRSKWRDLPEKLRPTEH